MLEDKEQFEDVIWTNESTVMIDPYSHKCYRKKGKHVLTLKHCETGSVQDKTRARAPSKLSEEHYHFIDSVLVKALYYLSRLMATFVQANDEKTERNTQLGMLVMGSTVSSLREIKCT